jgi:hypothetical protein
MENLEIGSRFMTRKYTHRAKSVLDSRKLQWLSNSLINCISICLLSILHYSLRIMFTVIQLFYYYLLAEVSWGYIVFFMYYIQNIQQSYIGLPMSMKPLSIINVHIYATDQILVILQLSDRLLSRKWQRFARFYQLFIDFKTTYDSVRREIIAQVSLIDTERVFVYAKLVRFTRARTGNLTLSTTIWCIFKFTTDFFF